ncbi:dTDP-4-amino-4,6-dideoxygalactose transaminase [Nocardioides sp. MAHUQ-72]|uniref:dTDP-4-amino-4,6-dideoxygalactose transaminase n=1 Tax=unclassified Nocardioides TaxID=2615069 RepID=UPI0036197B91
MSSETTTTATSGAPLPEIAFNEVRPEGDELAHVTASITSGRTQSSGPYSARVSDILTAETGAHEALLTTSCTAALELSALLLDLRPGDTVIVPSFTFVTSALAFVREGARIKFCDIEPETLGPDPRHVAELLDDSVRAVVVVHYAGIACDLDGLHEVLKDRPDVAIVEDAAHALFGRWRGRPLGSLGRFATLSFHQTKNIVCGEGGALLLNDPDDQRRAWVLHDKGTDRKAFFQGLVDKYSWRDIGSSFGLSDTLAAHLLGQLEVRASIQARRRAVFEGYLEALGPHAEALGMRLPVVPDHCEPAYHLFHVLLPDADARFRAIKELSAQGIGAAFHYVPLHDSDGGRQFTAYAGAEPPDCPVTTDVSERLLRLPFHNHLTRADVERVSEALVRFVSGT